MKPGARHSPVHPTSESFEWKWKEERNVSRSLSLSVCPSLSLALGKKVAFQFFKASLTIETEQKPKIAGDWALMRSTTSLLTAKNIWCFFLLPPSPPLSQGRELTELGSKNAGWEDWKREGCVCVDVRKGCCPFICVCLTTTVERGKKKKKGWGVCGTEGGIERERETA